MAASLRPPVQQDQLDAALEAQPADRRADVAVPPMKSTRILTLPSASLPTVMNGEVAGPIISPPQRQLRPVNAPSVCRLDPDQGLRLSAVVPRARW